MRSLTLITFFLLITISKSFSQGTKIDLNEGNGGYHIFNSTVAAGVDYSFKVGTAGQVSGPINICP